MNALEDNRRQPGLRLKQSDSLGKVKRNRQSPASPKSVMVNRAYHAKMQGEEKAAQERRKRLDLLHTQYQDSSRRDDDDADDDVSLDGSVSSVSSWVGRKGRKLFGSSTPPSSLCLMNDSTIRSSSKRGGLGSMFSSKPFDSRREEDDGDLSRLGGDHDICNISISIKKEVPKKSMECHDDDDDDDDDDDVSLDGSVSSVSSWVGRKLFGSSSKSNKGCSNNKRHSVPPSSLLLMNDSSTRSSSKRQGLGSMLSSKRFDIDGEDDDDDMSSLGGDDDIYSSLLGGFSDDEDTDLVRAQAHKSDRHLVCKREKVQKLPKKSKESSKERSGSSKREGKPTKSNTSSNRKSKQRKTRKPKAADDDKRTRRKEANASSGGGKRTKPSHRRHPQDGQQQPSSRRHRGDLPRKHCGDSPRKQHCDSPRRRRPMRKAKSVGEHTTSRAVPLRRTATADEALLAARHRANHRRAQRSGERSHVRRSSQAEEPALLSIILSEARTTALAQEGHQLSRRSLFLGDTPPPRGAGRSSVASEATKRRRHSTMTQENDGPPLRSIILGETKLPPRPARRNTFIGASPAPRGPKGTGPLHCLSSSLH